MRAQTAARLAWSLCAGSVVGVCGLVLLNVLNGVTGLGSWPRLGALLAFPIVGALVASRQPRNAVGWLLLTVGLCLTVSFTSESYARYVLVTAPGSLPAACTRTSCSAYFAVVAILAFFLPLYFPTTCSRPAGGRSSGRVPPSWRWPWSPTACSPRSSRCRGSARCTTRSSTSPRPSRCWTCSSA